MIRDAVTVVTAETDWKRAEGALEVNPAVPRWNACNGKQIRDRGSPRDGLPRRVCVPLASCYPARSASTGSTVEALRAGR